MRPIRLLSGLALGAALGLAPPPGAAAGATCTPDAPPGLYVQSGIQPQAQPQPGPAAGSRATPFATLADALSARRRTGLRTIYLLPGRFPLSATLVLDGRDNGASLVACTPGRAVLDGGGHLPVLMELRQATGLHLDGLELTGTAPDGTAVLLTGGNANTLSALRIHDVGRGVVLSRAAATTIRLAHLDHLRLSGIELKDGSDGNVLENNVISDVAANETHGGGIFLHGGSGNVIAHNLVQRTEGMGIAIANWDHDTINLDNSVTRNIVRNTVRASTDSGAIYVLGRSRLDTRTVIAENLVDGAGSPRQHSVGIYLDDSTSGVVVRGNILRRLGQIAFEVHGGSNNLITANIVDLGRTTRTAVLFQAAPADTGPRAPITGDVVRNNVFLAAGRPRRRLWDWLDGGDPLISGNLYNRALAAPVKGRVPLRDREPVYGDPGFTGHGDYTLRPDALVSRLGLTPVAASALGPAGGLDPAGG